MFWDAFCDAAGPSDDVCAVELKVRHDLCAQPIFVPTFGGERAGVFGRHHDHRIKPDNQLGMSDRSQTRSEAARQRIGGAALLVDDCPWTFAGEQRDGAAAERNAALGSKRCPRRRRLGFRKRKADLAGVAECGPIDTAW